MTVVIPAVRLVVARMLEWWEGPRTPRRGDRKAGSAGRFWGYIGLRPVLAVRQVTPDHGIQAGRRLRRWYRAKGLTKRVRRERVATATGRITYRTTTV